VDEVLTIHVNGSVQKQNDAMVAPTTSLPLIPILALLLERAGITRDHSVNLLRDVLTTAINNGQSKSEQIEARMKDVESAIKMVREQILATLPRQRRSGAVKTKDLQITILANRLSPQQQHESTRGCGDQGYGYLWSPLVCFLWTPTKAPASILHGNTNHDHDNRHRPWQQPHRTESRL
jgi:hypothetical protein